MREREEEKKTQEMSNLRLYLSIDVSVFGETTVTSTPGRYRKSIEECSTSSLTMVTRGN
jgi:hypothetical protein